jgi:hypothetical protein
MDKMLISGLGKDVGGSRLAAKFLKIALKFFYYKNMKNPKNLKIDYISTARRINPPRPNDYFWTLFCLELVKLMLSLPQMQHKREQPTRVRSSDAIAKLKP